MINVSHHPGPPSDAPKAKGLESLHSRMNAVKTGWSLRVGFDVRGEPIHLFCNEIVPPNMLRRLFMFILTGMKWSKTNGA